MTGEPVPVEKALRPVAREAPLGNRNSMLWSGTLMTQGSAKGLVVATGAGLDKLADAQLRLEVAGVDVFARTSPEPSCALSLPCKPTGCRSP